MVVTWIREVLSLMGVNLLGVGSPFVFVPGFQIYLWYVVSIVLYLALLVWLADVVIGIFKSVLSLLGLEHKKSKKGGMA